MVNTELRKRFNKNPRKFLLILHTYTTFVSFPFNFNMIILQVAIIIAIIGNNNNNYY